MEADILLYSQTVMSKTCMRRLKTTKFFNVSNFKLCQDQKDKV